MPLDDRLTGRTPAEARLLASKEKVERVLEAAILRVYTHLLNQNSASQLPEPGDREILLSLPDSQILSAYANLTETLIDECETLGSVSQARIEDARRHIGRTRAWAVLHSRRMSPRTAGHRRGGPRARRSRVVRRAQARSPGRSDPDEPDEHLARAAEGLLVHAALRPTERGPRQ
jgi:hypothetical protein